MYDHREVPKGGGLGGSDTILTPKRPLPQSNYSRSSNLVNGATSV
jgi:hypothetical protein